MHVAVRIAVVAAAATLADLTWYTLGIRHTLVAGVLHGALLLTVVGAALGSAHGQLVKGLPIGALAGLGGALSYYLLVIVLDSRTYGTAIPGAWIIMWLLLAALEGRWLRTPRRRWAEVAARGALAAVIGGVAFALVRTVLWGRPPSGGRSYLVQFAAWAVAWTPGLVALLWQRDAHHAASIAATDLLARIERGDELFILDVRTEGEFAAGHVPGARNIPFNQVRGRIGEVPGSKTDELVVYCGHGPRAHLAASALVRHRARIVYLAGHFAGWRDAGLRVER